MSADLQAQSITGSILDSETKNPLIAASIRIEGTGLGTITNSDGYFLVTPPAYPTQLIVSYIGYRTDTLVIQEPTNLTIPLKETDIRLPEIVVNANEDPALAIIRAAIHQKYQHNKDLKSFEFNAYARQTIKSDGELASVEETFIKGYGEPGKKLKEFVLSTRKTENIKASDMDSPTQGSFIDFYQERFEFAESNIVLPLADDAFDFYDYQLLHIRTDNEKEWYTIKLIPKSDLLLLLSGTLTIVSDDYALVGVDVTAGQGLNLPYIENFSAHVNQTLSNYEGFWLPQYSQWQFGFEVNFGGLIRLDKLEFSRTYTLTEVTVNRAIPKDVLGAKRSVYGGYTTDLSSLDQQRRTEKRAKRPRPVPSDSVFVPAEKPLTIDSVAIESLRPIPLSDAELLAFAELDSTKTLETFIKPKGPLSGLARVGDDEEGDENESSWWSEIPSMIEFRNNRVENLYLGLFYEHDFLSTPYFWSLRGGYAFGAKEAQYDAIAGWNLTDDQFTRIWLSVFREFRPWWGVPFHEELAVSIMHTLFASDPWNYNLENGMAVHGEAWIGTNLRITGRLQSVNLINPPARTPWSLINRDKPPRFNGFGLKSKETTFLISAMGNQDPMSWANVPETGFRVDYEVAKPLLDSPWDWSQLTLAGQVRWSPLWKEMGFPPFFLFKTIYVVTTPGTPFFRLPFTISGIDAFNPSGGFLGLNSYEISGTTMASFYAEWYLKGVPFRLVGLDGIADKGIELIIGARMLTFQNAIGPFRQYIPYAEYHVGLSKLFGILRTDAVVNSEGNLLGSFGIGLTF